MAKCDLCGESCSAVLLGTLREIYQTGAVKDLCPTCEKWADKQLDEVRAMIAPQVQARIEARLARNNRPSWWRRLLGKRSAS